MSVGTPARAPWISSPLSIAEACSNPSSNACSAKTFSIGLAAFEPVDGGADDVGCANASLTNGMRDRSDRAWWHGHEFRLPLGRRFPW